MTLRLNIKMDVKLLKSKKYQLTLLVILFCMFFGFSSHKAEAATDCTDTSLGVVTQSYTVPAGQEGNYKLWVRMKTETAGNDSVWFKNDDGGCVLVGDTGLSPGSWKWVDYQNGNINSKMTGVALSARTYQLKLIGREAGVMVDKILLVKDYNCSPDDMQGNPCLTDTTKPQVTVNTPSGQSGMVTLSANATDNIGIQKVTYILDGTTLSPSATTPPYNFSLDTTKLSNGQHKLKARAEDTSGNTTDSSEISFNVNNTVPDTTKPQVSVNSPSGQSGIIKLSANATDNVAVKEVTYILDGASLTPAVTKSPYYYDLDTTKLTNGSHKLKATAVDTSGNQGDSSEISFNVNNTVPDTTKPQVTITNPQGSNTSIPEGSFTFSANATDNVGIQKVIFKLDGQIIGSPVVAPFVATTNLVKGSHTLEVTAVDTSNLTDVKTLQVTVFASTPTATCDFDGDGIVWRGDMNAVAKNWGKNVPVGTSGDCSGPSQVPDGKVWREDMNAIARKWGQKVN